MVKWEFKGAMGKLCIFNYIMYNCLGGIEIDIAKGQK